MTELDAIVIPEGFSVADSSTQEIKGRYLSIKNHQYLITDNQDQMPRYSSREFLYCKHICSSVLIYCSNESKVLLLRQFRYPCYYNANKLELENPERKGWIYEIIAGIVEKNETPESTAVREAQEEGNVIINIENLVNAHRAFTSPGMSNEEIYIFLYNLDKISNTFSETISTGLKSENENIRAKWLTYEEVRNLVKNKEIVDLKTIASLYSAKII